MLRIVTPVLFGLCGAFVGCGSSKTEFTEVKGTVTYKGQKLTHGMVVFKSKDGNQRGVSPISAQGTFSIKSPVGPVVAAVVTSPDSDKDLKDENRPAVKDVVVPRGINVANLPPTKYESFNTSQLSYDIQPGNQPINITLN